MIHKKLSSILGGKIEFVFESSSFLSVCCCYVVLGRGAVEDFAQIKALVYCIVFLLAEFLSTEEVCFPLEFTILRLIS